MTGLRKLTIVMRHSLLQLTEAFPRMQGAIQTHLVKVRLSFVLASSLISLEVLREVTDDSVLGRPA